MASDNPVRYRRILYNINKIVDLWKEEKGERLKPFVYFNSLISDLWPSFLSSEEIVQHFMDVSNFRHRFQTGGFSTSLLEFNLLERANENNTQVILEALQHPVYSQNKLYDRISEVEIENLLKDHYQVVYEIYDLTTYIVEELRSRFQDAFHQAYKRLDDLICSVQGESFSILSQDDTLLKAFCVRNILTSGMISSHSLLSKIFTDFTNIRQIKLENLDVNKLMVFDQKLKLALIGFEKFSSELSLNDMTLILLEVSENINSYSLKKIIDLIKKHNVDFDSQKDFVVSVESVEKILEEKEKNEKETKEKSLKRFDERHCLLAEYAK